MLLVIYRFAADLGGADETRRCSTCSQLRTALRSFWRLSVLVVHDWPLRACIRCYGKSGLSPPREKKNKGALRLQEHSREGRNGGEAAERRSVVRYIECWAWVFGED